MKNTEGKNEQQIQAIINQKKQKQSETIKDQKENKPKIIEKDKIVYLKNEIDELFKMYPTSFTNQGKNLLRILADNENKIDYKKFVLQDFIS